MKNKREKEKLGCTKFNITWQLMERSSYLMISPDQMMISMPSADPSPQEISKVRFTMPAYYQPELFSGPLEYPPQYPYQLPPPSNTSNLNALPSINHILDMNCRDIDTHLKGCPVCGQLHKSNAYVYIGIIVFLILICFFLGRKFFD